jgi:hypothetical protein
LLLTHLCFQLWIEAYLTSIEVLVLVIDVIVGLIVKCFRFCNSAADAVNRLVCLSGLTAAGCHWRGQADQKA